MITKKDLQDAFVAAVQDRMMVLGFERGGQARIAKRAGLSPSYLNDILKKRKLGSEEAKRKLAFALGSTYEELLTIGTNINKSNFFTIEACVQHAPFTQDRAACIYRYAAREAGIRNSYFFKEDTLRRSRPPGWMEYLNREIRDDELYECAKKEVEALSEGVENVSDA